MSQEEAISIFGLSTGFGLFIIFLGILWWVLCIILFFKVWGMTNDIRKIKDMFEEQLDLEHPYIEEGEPANKKDGSK